MTVEAAITPVRTVPVYTSNCSYNHCFTPRVYHFTPTPYTPVITYNQPIYRRYLPVRHNLRRVYKYTPRFVRYYW